MQAADITVILAYYGDIPELLKQTEKELREFDEEYNCLHGIAMDGMPHGSMPGNVTAALAEKLSDDIQRAQRIILLCDRRENLKSDRASIEAQINTLGIVAERLVVEHYAKNRSWKDIGTPQCWSIPTKKRKAALALARLANSFNKLPDGEKILARARDARAI